MSFGLSSIKGKIAMCRRCGAPLVSTMAFRQYEFYCLDCGWLCGWLDPTPGESTPELVARTEADAEEWKVLSAGLLADGGHHKGCEPCRKEEHRLHATEAEIAADVAARARISARISVQI